MLVLNLSTVNADNYIIVINGLDDLLRYVGRIVIGRVRINYGSLVNLLDLKLSVVIYADFNPLRLIEAAELGCSLTVSALNVNGEAVVNVVKESFSALTVTEGEGEIFNCGDALTLKKGDTVFVTADCGEVRFRGKMTVIRSQL